MVPPETSAVSLLLVDDLPANLLALEAVLAPLGHSLVKATSGEEALRLLLHQDFAAILMDVRLKGLSGVEATELIRQRERNRYTPILLFTALDSHEEEVLQGYLHGAVDYLRKPFNPQVLRAKVSIFVELYLAREEVKRQAERLREQDRQLLERAQRVRLQSMLMQAPAAIAITSGPEFVFEFANPLYEKVVGRSIALGKPLREVLPEVLSQPGVMGALQRTMRTGQPFVGRAFPVALDRHGAGAPEQAWFDLVYQPLRNERGEVEGLLTHAVEVTEQVLARQRTEALAEELRTQTEALRLSEERLRLAVSATALGTWDFNPMTGELRCDARCMALLGMPPAAVISWDAFLERIHPEDRERADHQARQALEPTGSGEFLSTYRTVGLQNGVERWVRSTGRAFFEGGRAVRFVGSIQDITESKQQEAEARKREEFERQLIGIVSHDLRNPLAAIITAADMLLHQEAWNERSKKAATRITSAATRAAGLIEDLLDFTQARLGGHLPIQRQPMDLHVLARQVVEEMELTAPTRSIELVHQGDGTGEWDSGRLAQLLTNLLGNALTYSPPDTPVRLEVEGESECVTLTVRNQGDPIPAEVLPRIFEPLQRGTETPDLRRRSIGLGLFIVESIVRAHGGTVAVHSTAHEGTVFTVRLPRDANRRAQRSA